jgi:hypothetical protein
MAIRRSSRGTCPPGSPVRSLSTSLLVKHQGRDAAKRRRGAALLDAASGTYVREARWLGGRHWRWSDLRARRGARHVSILVVRSSEIKNAATTKPTARLASDTRSDQVLSLTRLALALKAIWRSASSASRVSSDGPAPNCVKNSYASMPTSVVLARADLKQRDAEKPTAGRMVHQSW